MPVDIESALGKSKLKAFFLANSPRHPAKRLAVFDYDGTLIPVGLLSGAATLGAAETEALQVLKKNWTLMILTGRSVDDLESRLTVKQRQIFDAVIGNHGIENPLVASEAVESHVVKMQALSEQLKDTFASQTFKNFEIEDKKSSWTLHFPTEISEQKAKELAAPLFSTKDFRLIHGKGLVNILPIEASNKGSALSAILDNLPSSKAFFIGDDFTDEDVFKREDPRIFGVRVGQDKATSAQFTVKNHESVVKVINMLSEI